MIIAHSLTLYGQKQIDLNAADWVAVRCSAEFEGDAIHVRNNSEQTAFLWMRDVNFKNGAIELDLRGKDVRGESFLGVAFHAASDTLYNAVYFRPFNFRDPERKDHAVQYVRVPGSDWDVLRERFPGKYESTVQPVPDPNDWFHVRIEVAYPMIKVFVEHSLTPSLVVNQLDKQKTGKLGLWLDCKEGWFRKISISR